ncbi:MAG TPA: hypothetical protein VIR77_03165 [Pontiella sp.]
MNTRNSIIALMTLSMVSAGHAENFSELLSGIAAQTNHTPKALIDVRTRYEFGEQENLDPAHAATMRARIGLESQNYNGFTGLIEFEATRAIDTTSYRAGGVHGDPATTVIADPENTELNRMQLQYVKGDHSFVAGRQRIILDNARFVGNVGWRQNEQTYDAATYKNKAFDNFTLFYGYIEEVKRIFGDDATGAAKQFDSDSHLLNVAYTGIDKMKITGYSYWLDFDNAQPNSTDTIGISLDYKTKIDEYDVNTYLELAYQEEGSDAPVEYDAVYAHVSGSVKRAGYTGLLGYELLGSDGGSDSFKTPLATGHKFNGWNDQFLATPAAGLQDFYVGIGLPLPKAKLPLTLVYHYFRSDSGSVSYGSEIDAVTSYAINKKTKAIAKASYFEADDTGLDRFRLSAEINFKY